MSECQRKVLTNDVQMYAIGIHLSHVDVGGNAHTAVASDGSVVHELVQLNEQIFQLNELN